MEKNDGIDLENTEQDSQDIIEIPPPSPKETTKRTRELQDDFTSKKKCKDNTYIFFNGQKRAKIYFFD